MHSTHHSSIYEKPGSSNGNSWAWSVFIPFPHHAIREISFRPTASPNHNTDHRTNVLLANNIRLIFHILGLKQTKLRLQIPEWTPLRNLVFRFTHWRAFDYEIETRWGFRHPIWEEIFQSQAFLFLCCSLSCLALLWTFYPSYGPKTTRRSRPWYSITFLLSVVQSHTAKIRWNSLQNVKRRYLLKFCVIGVWLLANVVILSMETCSLLSS